MFECAWTIGACNQQSLTLNYLKKFSPAHPMFIGFPLTELCNWFMELVNPTATNQIDVSSALPAS